VLCVNTHCYVLDSRNGTSGAYECYYWENVPAVTFSVGDGELWFGTEDGKICKFNTDVDNVTAYEDNGVATTDSHGRTVVTGGDAIRAHWATAQDNDNYPQYFKTMNKKGSVLTLRPYTKSSATLYFSKDGDEPVKIGYTTVDFFDWEYIDFTRFTFKGNDSAVDVYGNKKIKKYKTLQLIVENNEIDEPFGVIQLTKTWTLGNFAK